MLCSLGMVPEPTLRFYFAEALCGLRYLHQEGVLHHDIKPQNMLIAANGHLKLADFGLSSGLSNNVGHGTLPYIAPEVLRRRRDRLHGKRPSSEPVTAPMAAAPTVATPRRFECWRRRRVRPRHLASTCGHTESSSSSCSAECWPLGLAAIENCQLRCGLLAAFGAVKTPRGPHCD